MKFAEKIRMLRKQTTMTQDDVANAIGISRRAYISYENDGRYPRNREIYEKLATLFSCDVDYLLTEREEFIIDTAANYGSHGKRQAEELVSELSMMFAGGELSDSDMDAVFYALQKAYIYCKERNKKYTPKKYLKNGKNAEDNK